MSEGPWDRWMRGFIPFCFRFWWLIVPSSIVLAVGSIQVAQSLKLDTDLSRLLPESSEVVANLKVIQKKSGGSHDLRVVLEGGSLEAKIMAAKEFSAHLKSMKQLVHSVQYTTPKIFFDKHRYELISLPALEAIDRRVHRERSKHSDLIDPLGLEASIAAPSIDVPISVGGENSPQMDESELERAKELLTRLDSMLPYYQTEDGKFLSLRIIPAGEKLDISTNKVILNEFKNLVHDFGFTRFDPAIRTSILGSIPDHIERYESIASDVKFGVWGAILILLLVALYFRSIWSLAILVPPLIISLSVGLAVVAQYEKTLNSITVFLVLVIFGMGIEFGLHLFSRYIDEQKKNSSRDSLLATWQSTGRATITSSLALLAGYAILVVSSFQGFAQFGRVAIILVLFTALGFLGLMPSWILFIERIRGRQRPWPYTITQALMYRSRGRFLWSPRMIFSLKAISICLAVIGLTLSAFYLRFDYQFDDAITRKASSSREAMGQMYTQRMKPSAVAVFKDREGVDKFLQYYEARKNEYPDIALANGLPSFLPVDQDKRIAKLTEIADGIETSWLKHMEDKQIRKALLEIKDKADHNEFQPFGPSEIPPELRDPFTSIDGSGDSLAYLFDLGGATNGKKAMKFSDAVQKIKSESGLLDIVSGQEMVFADVVRRVIEEGPLLVLGMLLLVFAICWLDFRKLKDAFVTIQPVLLGFLMTGGILVISDNNINFYNMVALASLGSMVVDNSIHLYHRFLEFRDEGAEEPARDASRAVSPTIIICSLTSMLGYFGMVFATHKGIASLGFVAVSGLFCCLISATLLFPSWLHRKAI